MAALDRLLALLATDRAAPDDGSRDPSTRGRRRTSPTRSSRSSSRRCATRAPDRRPRRRAPAFPGSSSRPRCPRRAWRSSRAQREEVRVPRARGRGDGPGERRGRCALRAEEWEAGLGRVRPRDGARAWRRSTCSSSTPRRCSPRAARSSRGRGAATPARRPTATRRPPRLGLAPARRARRARHWAGAEHLHLHVYVKVGSTPNRYPRRPGMASKRPLRAAS